MADKPGGTLTSPSRFRRYTPPEPPPQLGAMGAKLWRSVVERFEVSNPGTVETLYQCCAAADRAEACRVAINRDGELVEGAGGPREHPLLRHEIQSRALAVRTLAKLGLDLQPTKRDDGRRPGVA
jgi:hypothetical protein